MKLPNWLIKIAEILFKGRQAGMWSEKKGPTTVFDKGLPHKPEDTKGIRQ